MSKIKKGDTVKVEAKAIQSAQPVIFKEESELLKRIDNLELSKVKFISQLDMLESNIQTCFEMINKQAKMIKEVQLQLEEATRTY